MIDHQRPSDIDQSKRDIPSFIEPRPPLISNPFMRPRPQKGTNLMELFDEDSESDEPELVQVYLRLKPCSIKNNLYEVKSDRCLITSLDTATAGHGRRTQHNVPKMYTFTNIFGPESTQKEVFAKVVKENLKKLPDGQNFTLMTYGASGSGKTFTLMGTVQHPGLVPLSLEYVFRVVEAAQRPLYKPTDGGGEKLSYQLQEYEIQWVNRLRHVSVPFRDKFRRMSAQLHGDFTASTLDLSNRTRYYVWVTFVEIYNDGIYDLLTNTDRSKATAKLRIREDTSGNVYVKGATQAFVRTAEEAYDVMVVGKHNLQVAATGVHAHSSRSHCIFTITMLTETDGGVRTSCVRLCDLAGSERARQTRNTGARMKESRSINSSLHVLERCLHMLRRKQRQRIDATLVPYRESKLTRLLGAGLSGARNEAVSMVVTLNPAPEYAMETRHVLQLAAVAKDIQVNHTLAEASIESAQNSTIECGAEVTRLRAENQRLHFELYRAEARVKELVAAAEDKQKEVANTMFEYVAKARDMEREYYEAQIASLRTKMDDMKEEYEELLSAAEQARENSQLPSDAGTSSRSLQIKIEQLIEDNAILEERLAEEKLARERADAEIQHLRACLDERDELAAKEFKNDVILVETDSEEEDESYNESLEPTFKKKDLNLSRILQHSLSQDHEGSCDDITGMDNDHNSTFDHHDTDHGEEIDKSGETVNGEESHNETVKDSVAESVVLQEVTETKDEENESRTPQDNVTHDSSSESFNKLNINDEPVTVKKVIHRETYYVEDVESSKVLHSEIVEEPHRHMRGTYFVKDSVECNISDSNDVFKENNNENIEYIKDRSDSETMKVSRNVNRRKPMEGNHGSDISLAHFEKLEKDVNTYKDSKCRNEKLINFNILKGKRTFFDDNTEKVYTDNFAQKKNKEKTYFDDIDLKIDTSKNITEVRKDLKLMNDDDRSPSLVKEVFTKVVEPCNTKKLLGPPAVITSDINKTLPKNKHGSLDIFDGFDSPYSILKEKEKRDSDKSIIKPTESLNISKEKNNEDMADTAVENLDVSSVQNKVDIKEKSIEKLEISKGENILELKETSIKNLDIFKEHKKEVLKKTDPINTPKPDHSTFVQENLNSVLNSPSIEETFSEEETKNKQKCNNNSVNSLELVELLKETTTEKLIHLKTDNNAVSLEKQHFKPTEKVDIIETTQKFINTMVLDQKIDKINLNLDSKIKQERLSIVQESLSEKIQIVSNNKATVSESQISFKENNTIDDFENIYKDITAPRATEFELLVSQDINASNIKDNSIERLENEAESIRYNLRHKNKTNKKEKDTEQVIKQTGEKIESEFKSKTEQVVKQTSGKIESEFKSMKKNLRLRRRNKETEDDKHEQEEEFTTLKDMVNLQKEFSDVTLDKPAPVIERKDMASPEKVAEEEENLPPCDGIQSCPSKSVTRSRRKLFTPRPEPLDESPGHTGDSGERVRVPRPSYHRTRVRRKL